MTKDLSVYLKKSTHTPLKRVFNAENTEWKTGDYSLFLGQAPALYDSIHQTHPRIFELYKLQKAIDWNENEVSLVQSRQDLLTTSKNNYDIMLKNLAFQWELDSVAARSIAPLLAPFVTNSELWAAYCKVTEVEILHSLTYSEIVRQCIPNPVEAISEAMENMQVIERSTAVVDVLDNLATVGAKYTLGSLSKDSPEVEDAVLLGVVAIYLLERVEFMASFAATFSLGEQGIFQGICKLVQKIAQDEALHFALGEEVLKGMRKEGWGYVFERNHEAITTLLADVVKQELSWNKYLFSEGRNIVGLNNTLLDEWVIYNVTQAADVLQVESGCPEIRENPLPWMDNWLDLNKFQNANQEADNTNYSLNTVVNDVDEDEELSF